MKAHPALVIAAALASTLLSIHCGSAVPAEQSGPGVVVEDGACPLATHTWGRDVWFRIKRYWKPDKLVDSGRRGAVLLHFYVARDGKVIEVTTLRRKGFRSLERDAQETVQRAAPFAPPPFADRACERLGVQIAFFYNMSDEAQAEWLAAVDEESTE